MAVDRCKCTKPMVAKNFIRWADWCYKCDKEWFKQVLNPCRKCERGRYEDKLGFLKCLWCDAAEAPREYASENRTSSRRDNRKRDRASRELAWRAARGYPRDRE